MNDDVGQRVSSEAGGQERESFIRQWSQREGSWHPSKDDAKLLLAALDAANSRAEEAERQVTDLERLCQRWIDTSADWIAVNQMNVARAEAAEARIRELEAELEITRGGHAKAVTRAKRAEERAEIFELMLEQAQEQIRALSQATKREGEE